jgi:hypothetical protein
MKIPLSCGTFCEMPSSFGQVPLALASRSLFAGEWQIETAAIQSQFVEVNRW